MLSVTAGTNILKSYIYVYENYKSCKICRFTFNCVLLFCFIWHQTLHKCTTKPLVSHFLKVFLKYKFLENVNLDILTQYDYKVIIMVGNLWQSVSQSVMHCIVVLNAWSGS